MILATMTIIILAITNFISLSLLTYFYLKSRKKKKTESVELQEFLMDLLSGDGLIHVKRIAPSDIFVRMRR